MSHLQLLLYSVISVKYNLYYLYPDYLQLLSAFKRPYAVTLCPHSISCEFTRLYPLEELWHVGIGHQVLAILNYLKC